MKQGISNRINIDTNCKSLVCKSHESVVSQQAGAFQDSLGTMNDSRSQYVLFIYSCLFPSFPQVAAGPTPPLPSCHPCKQKLPGMRTVHGQLCQLQPLSTGQLQPLISERLRSNQSHCNVSGPTKFQTTTSTCTVSNLTGTRHRPSVQTFRKPKTSLELIELIQKISASTSDCWSCHVIMSTVL